MIDLFEPPSEEELIFRREIWKKHPDRLQNEARTFSIDIEAQDFPLNATYTLSAAVDLERAHGLNLEDELVRYLTATTEAAMTQVFSTAADMFLTTSSSTTATEVKMETYGTSFALNYLPIYLANVRNGCFFPGQAD